MHVAAGSPHFQGAQWGNVTRRFCNGSCQRQCFRGGCSAHPETKPLWWNWTLKFYKKQFWTPPEQHFTGVAFQLFFSVWRQQKRRRSFQSSSDISVLWYPSVGILKSQGSQVFFNFQSKAYQRRMSSRLPTHTYGRTGKDLPIMKELPSFRNSADLNCQE